MIDWGYYIRPTDQLYHKKGKASQVLLNLPFSHALYNICFEIYSKLSFFACVAIPLNLVLARRNFTLCKSFKTNLEKYCLYILYNCRMVLQLQLLEQVYFDILYMILCKVMV